MASCGPTAKARKDDPIGPSERSLLRKPPTIKSKPSKLPRICSSLVRYWRSKLSAAWKIENWVPSGKNSGPVAPVLSTWATLLERKPKMLRTVILPKVNRSEEHTSELQSLMRISYAVFCLKKKNIKLTNETN